MIKKTNAEKIKIFSDNGKEFLQTILNFDDLPIEMGGKNQIGLMKGFGIVDQELKKTWERKSIFLKDRSPEYEYFYTDNEKANIDNQKSTITVD